MPWGIRFTYLVVVNLPRAQETVKFIDGEKFYLRRSLAALTSSGLVCQSFWVAPHHGSPNRPVVLRLIPGTFLIPMAVSARKLRALKMLSPHKIVLVTGSTHNIGPGTVSPR
jgi:hypothetical protein